MNGLTETSIVTDVAFGAISIAAIISATVVVVIKDVFRAAVFLAATFFAMACLYFMLSAEFVALVQILVYVGAVSVIFAFAVMLVRDVLGSTQSSGLSILAATIGGLTAIAVIFVASQVEWNQSNKITDKDALAALVGSYTTKSIDSNRETVTVLIATDENINAQPGVLADSTVWLGRLLFREFVLPFETLGLLLVASLIGALVLVRGKDGKDGKEGNT